MRHDFTISTKELLAKRVAYRCSNPKCRKVTSGPQNNPSGSINIGIAAHITAASTGGQRFDSTLTRSQRQAVKNGIWLCQSCAKLVDNDPIRYTVDILQDWKYQSEKTTLYELENQSSISTNQYIKIEGLMHDLLEEIRKDLKSDPLGREFVILKKSWSYWPKGNELVYYFDDHPGLENKLLILQNHGFIRDITYNNVKRFIFSEDFVDYLLG